jgi:hypothetical protein
MVADYRLAYAQGSSTNRSQLTSITLCDGGGTCLPATTFGWQHGTMAVTTTPNVAGQNNTLSGYRPYAADFNGDGITDILWDAENQTPSTSTGTRVLWTGTGNGGFTVSGNFAGQDGQLSGYTPVIADFNRDGRPDIWWYQANSSGSTGPTTQWMSSNSGTYTVVAGAGAPAQNANLLAEFDGDGRGDMWWFKTNVLTTWWTQPNGGAIGATGTLWGCNAWPGWEGCSLYVGMADFNGDGITDLFWISAAEVPGKLWSTWLGSGVPNYGFGQYLPGSDSNLSGFTPLFVDVNGDGKTDILWYSIDGLGLSTGAGLLWLSKGDGTFTALSLSGLSGMTGYRPYIVDFNGDGLADILSPASFSTRPPRGRRDRPEPKTDCNVS